MKKLTGVVLAILLIWNVFLTVQVLSKSDIGSNRQIVNQSVSKITTDLTKLVESSQTKVVGVSTYRNNNLIGTGSGVVYYSDGSSVTIVTNNHVIEKGSIFKVTFANGEELEAKKIGTDLVSDIAVLKVDIDFSIASFKLGDSSLVSVGEYVIAIGSPLGLNFQGTTTFGIISGKDRLIPVDLDGNGYEDWDSIVLQTDAAINPGNSGGALVNLAGELIGITSMKIADSDVEGMGFAIPINEVISIVSQIQENGKVIRPILGVSGYGISDLSNIEKSYLEIDLASNVGVYIYLVGKASAAEKAGIKEGDIIIKFAGVDIRDYKQFRQELYKKNVNDKVSIVILRGGQTLTLEAVLQ